MGTYAFVFDPFDFFHLSHLLKQTPGNPQVKKKKKGRDLSAGYS